MLAFPDVKTQVLRIEQASGTAAGIEQIELKTFSDYKRISGILIPVPDTFDPPLRLGISDAGLTYFEIAAIRMYASSLSLNHKERFLGVDIRAGGNRLTLQLQRVSTLAADYDFDIIFRYEEPA